MGSSKYSDKMKDSYKTKLKIFFFSKAFEFESVDDYLHGIDIDEIKKAFCEFGRVTENVAKIYASEYYQWTNEKTVTYNGVEKKVGEIVAALRMKKCTSNEYYLNTSLLSDEIRSNLKKGTVCEKYDKYLVIYDELLKEYKKEFEDNIFPKKDFDDMLDKEPGICEYCRVSIVEINQLGQNGKLYNKRAENRGYSLEIDRKNPNLEYEKENCCMSCYWCNNAKTDEFFPDEFASIAESIKSVWKKRLGLINN